MLGISEKSNEKLGAWLGQHRLDSSGAMGGGLLHNPASIRPEFALELQDLNSAS